MALILYFLKPNAPDFPMEAMEKVLMTMPEGPFKFALVLSRKSKQLLAMSRYERRALSRRKFAIRALDAARGSATKTEEQPS